MFEGIQIRGVRQKQIHKGILLGKIFSLGVDIGHVWLVKLKWDMSKARGNKHIFGKWKKTLFYLSRPGSLLN